MAARDNQTLQIIVLVFVFISVIGIGASIWFYSQAKAERAEVARLQSQEQERSRAYSELQREAEEYRQMMGFKEEDNVQTVREAVQQDMAKYGETFAEGDRNYRKIVDHLKTENDQLTTREQSARQELVQLNQKYLAVQEEKTQSIAEFQQKSQQETATLAAERKKFQDERDAFEKMREELRGAAQQVEDQYKQTVAEKDAEIQTLSEEIRDKTTIIAQLNAGRQQDHTVFERADGRINWVNQATGTVWINLGHADALREQITFSVYDVNSPVAGHNEPKATIEVTRIAGEHLAEARITQDQPLNPIVPGDQIYSPVWEKGKQVRFALTGRIDLDGDGRDDSERARRLITSNGGLVDAYVDEQGELVGQMTVNTRFLIVGEEPSGRDAALTKKMSDARQAMLREAGTKGVDLISVDKFLSFVGWRPGEKTITLGAGARAADFPPEPAGGRSLSTGSTTDSSATESFRKRFPVTPF